MWNLESMLQDSAETINYRTVPLHGLQTYTDDNVQYTHTYTQYTQVLLLGQYLTVINTHYTPYVHILHYVHIYTYTVMCNSAVDRGIVMLE